MAQEMMARAEADQTSFPPPPRDVEVEGQEEPIPVQALVVAFRSVLSRVPPRPLVYVGHAWTLDQKLAVVRDRIHRGSFDLVEQILESEDRLEAVVTFVAILELLRLGEIRIRQRKSFDEIWVEAA
jgi:chromatin segregation and condensation protein Rec8/ScpA/Scc1 (kleisin family)